MQGWELAVASCWETKSDRKNQCKIVSSPATPLGRGGAPGLSQVLWFPPVPLDEIEIELKCLKRPFYPEDLVGTAVFLASDNSRFITGQFILHGGGLSFH
jgi:NAD(P)-dependent dehydrogenase (short-subunit alcohol dehydrogenase family)